MSELVTLVCPNCSKICERPQIINEKGVVEDEWCPQCEYLMEETNLRAFSSGEIQNQTVVRVRTSYFQNKSGYHFQKTLRKMKKLSRGEDIFEADCKNFGIEQILPLIRNLHSCEDGLYLLVFHGDEVSWDYSLIPYTNKE